MRRSDASRLALAAGFALAALGAAGAQEAGYALSGSMSFEAAASGSGDALADGDLAYGSASVLELGLESRRPGLRASFSGEAAVLSGRAAALAASAPGDSFVAAAADGGSALSLSIDRAFLRWTPGPLAATLGRQVVNWGSALLWSPADLFAETELSGLSAERAGTDALRLALPLGDLGGVEAVAAPTLSPAEGAYGGRLYAGLPGADLGVEGAWDGGSGEATLAANLKADALVGLWAEAAWTWPTDGGTIADGRLEATAGFDWSWSSTLFFAAEYRYDSEGVSAEADALARAAAGERYAGAHCLYASARAALGDLASVGAVAVADLGSGVAVVTVAASLDVAQGSELSLWASCSNGNLATLAEEWSAAAGASLALSF